MSDKQEVLRSVLASLTAQMNNLPKASLLEEVYVKNFHEQLDALLSAGFDVQKFRVPSEQVRRIESQSGGVTHGEVYSPTYSPEKYTDRSLLLTKIETVLRYFDIQKDTIGFKS